MIKRLAIVILGLGLLGICINQSRAQQPEKEFNLKLPVSDIQIISDALSEMSYKKAAPLMQKLQIQINNQIAPPQKEETKPEENKSNEGK